MSTMTKNIAIALGGAILALTLGHGALAADTSKLPPAAKKAGVTFASDIKPLFDRSCIKCHGPEKQKGGLRFDSLENLQKSKKKVVKAGASAQSMVVLSVAGMAPKEEENMPPAGKAPPFTPEEVGLLRAWIDQGAK